MHSAFITRHLAPDSDFRSQLEVSGWYVSGQSLVLFEPIPFELSTDFDWIFFSSQQAVHFFFKQISPSYFSNNAVPYWAALGAGTAKSMSGYIGRVDFTGTGEPISSASDFKRLAAGQTVLFPGASQSRESVQLRLKTSVIATSLSIYHNIPTENPILRTEDVLVFTSPMNVSAYFTAHVPEPYQRCVAIGQTTLLALQEFNIPNVVVAAVPTEAGLAAAVKSTV